MSKRFEQWPKVEAHLHLDGALRPKFIQRLARKEKHALGRRSLGEITRQTVIERPMNSLVEVLQAFHVITPFLQNAWALEETAYEICREAHEQNCFYFEVRYAPILSQRDGFSVDDAMMAIFQGLARGRKDFDVESGFIMTLLRNLPRRDNERMFESALRFKKQGVVAIDLANDEAAKSLDDYADFYQEAIRQGLKTVVHAGEVFPSPDLAKALDLGISRIGHGVFLPRYPDLMQEYAKRGLAIEINPTSNLRTAAIGSYKEHPARQFLEAGISMVLGTDDPGLFGIDLSHEYHVAHEKIGLSLEELRGISWNSIDCLFLSVSSRSRLRQRFLKNRPVHSESSQK
ncbi:MAG: adenosine deaminase [Elusimicrobia bacterium]|nr:adenosine deaminase [Elusimicrobiota bacterium]